MKSGRLVVWIVKQFGDKSNRQVAFKGGLSFLNREGFAVSEEGQTGKAADLAAGK